MVTFCVRRWKEWKCDVGMGDGRGNVGIRQPNEQTSIELIRNCCAVQDVDRHCIIRTTKFCCVACAAWYVGFCGRLLLLLLLLFIAKSLPRIYRIRIHAVALHISIPLQFIDVFVLAAQERRHCADGDTRTKLVYSSLSLLASHCIPSPSLHCDHNATVVLNAMVVVCGCRTNSTKIKWINSDFYYIAYTLSMSISGVAYPPIHLVK